MLESSAESSGLDRPPDSAWREDEARRAPLVGVAVLWFVAVGAVFAGVAAYKGTPGAPSGSAPVQYPVDSPLPRAPGEQKLLLFLHPECACSHATLAELERLLVGAPREGLSVELVFTLPRGVDDDFADTALHRKAERLALTRTHLDRGGELAASFGAGTSGHTLFYDEAGALRFSGGITPSRGHEGASPGGHRLAALLHGDPSDTATSAVYGCALEDELSQGTEDDDATTGR